MEKGKGEEVRFVYDEAAVVVTVNGTGYLVIGDLHIGAERKLVRRGIRVYSAVEAMTKKIRALMEQFQLKNMVILGDVKDTILYPDTTEQNEIKRFFGALKEYKIVVTVGNHDPHLTEIVAVDVKEELIEDGFAFLHGHKWPSDEAMKCRYLFVGHNHAAVSMTDRNMGFYSQKAWLIANLKKKTLERYPDCNKNIRLVVLPAFNDLITGMPVNEVFEENLSPLFRNGVFDYKGAKVYSLRGELVGTPATIKPACAKKKRGKRGKVRK